MLLEKRWESEEQFRRQCGGVDGGGMDPRTVFYDGGTFPFADGEFDYVICGHVLEHVPDVEQFCSEVFRVGKSGYFEYPLVYYDFVYDIPEHVNALKKHPDALVYLRKEQLGLSAFAGVQRFWFESLTAGYSDTVGDLVPWLMEGYEWFAPFDVRPATSLAELLHETLHVPAKAPAPTGGARLMRRVRSAGSLLSRYVTGARPSR